MNPSLNSPQGLPSPSVPPDWDLGLPTILNLCVDDAMGLCDCDPPTKIGGQLLSLSLRRLLSQS